MSKIIMKGRGIMPGIAMGPALIGKSLQVGGALNFKTGKIIQTGHELRGYFLKDCVLIIAGAKGSTGWSAGLHAIYINGMGPVAMVFPKIDARTAGAVAALQIPAVTDLDQDPYQLIKTGDMIKVDGSNGLIINYKNTNLS